jgi:CBS domain containing-hemolysin-like protein
VVVDQDDRGNWTPRGLIQHRDIVARVLSQPEDELDAIPALCAMTDRLEVTREDADLMETVMMMREARLPYMPVVDRHGGLSGLLRLEDLFQYLEVLTRALEFLVAKERSAGRSEPPN